MDRRKDYLSFLRSIKEEEEKSFEEIYSFFVSMFMIKAYNIVYNILSFLSIYISLKRERK